MAAITDAWRSSDSAKALVRALEESGFFLARGRRPYLVVDIYGKESALPRMIDDRSVRAEDVVKRLEDDFPPESLPSVEEAKALAAEHRKAREDFAKATFKAEELTRLKDRQAERRQKIEADVAKEEERQGRDRRDLKERHRHERAEARAQYLAEVRRIRGERFEREPKGFSGLLSRFTGTTRIREMIQRQRDKKLYDTFVAGRLDLRERQESEERALQHRHHLQKLDLDRRLRALTRIEERERQSLETKKLAEQRTKQRGSREQMPAISLELKPKGRPAAPHKAKNRYISEHREKKRKLPKAEITEKTKKLSLSEEFDRVSGERRSEGEGSGGATEPKPVSEKKARTQRTRKQETSIELGEEFRCATGERQSTSGGDEGQAQAPRKRERRPRDPDRPKRPRRPRDRGPDRGR